MITGTRFEYSRNRWIARVALLAATFGLFASLAGDAGDDATRRLELRKRAADIRDSAADLFKLGRVPWITDPAEGFRLARKENRPVFLYLQAGDPLEDC